MRHGKKNNHLGRTDSHRKAMLSNMASSLILHKRINTTVAKAKALRVYVEPLLTKSKTDSTHNRRVVFSYLQDKESVTVLFREVATKIAERQGGYTRIIKTGARMGDNAEMCFIELVDYNELYNSKAETKKAKTTRRGRSSGKPATAPAGTTDVKFDEVKSAKVKPAADKSEHGITLSEESAPETTAIDAAAENVAPVAAAEAHETEAPEAAAEVHEGKAPEAPAASTPHSDEPAEGADESKGESAEGETSEK